MHCVHPGSHPLRSARLAGIASWLAGVSLSSWLAGVSSWLAGVSSWLAGVPYEGRDSTPHHGLRVLFPK